MCDGTCQGLTTVPWMQATARTEARVFSQQQGVEPIATVLLSGLATNVNKVKLLIVAQNDRHMLSHKEATILKVELLIHLCYLTCDIMAVLTCDNVQTWTSVRRICARRSMPVKITQAVTCAHVPLGLLEIHAAMVSYYSQPNCKNAANYIQVERGAAVAV